MIRSWSDLERWANDDRRLASFPQRPANRAALPAVRGSGRLLDSARAATPAGTGRWSGADQEFPPERESPVNYRPIGSAIRPGGRHAELTWVGHHARGWPSIPWGPRRSQYASAGAPERFAAPDWPGRGRKAGLYLGRGAEGRPSRLRNWASMATRGVEYFLGKGRGFAAPGAASLGRRLVGLRSGQTPP